MSRIRPSTHADIPILLALASDSDTAAQWTPTQYEAIFATQPRRVALVIEEKEAVAGFVVAQVLGAEWEIENVAVAPEARRRGLATRLVGELLDRARHDGATRVFLEVRESNLAARALYEKWRFAPAGCRKAYYTLPSEDALIYEFTFSSVDSEHIEPE